MSRGASGSPVRDMASEKYALLMYADPDHTRAMSRADVDVVMRKHEALRDELTQSGELLNGAGLVLPDETTVLRLGEDGVITQQGPLATGSIEHLTAYYVIECADADRARRLAEHLLDHHVTAVEVRRIHDFVGM
jgi:hypothetical protein